MFKRLLMLVALLSAFMVLPGAVQAGLFVTVDVDDNGSIDGWFQADPIPSNPFGPLNLPVINVGGLEVSVTISTSESGSQSFISTSSVTVDATGAPDIALGSLRILALFTNIALPGGDPLLLGSSISTPDFTATDTLVTGTNTSYLNTIAVVPGLPNSGPPGVAPAITVPGAGGLVALIPNGPLFPADFIDAETALRPRPAGTFDLLSNVLISFDFTEANTLQIQTQTFARGVVPELSSIVGWSVCALLGLMIAGRRRRAA